MRRPMILVVAAILALMTACSGSPPRIARISSQLLYVNDLYSDRIYESLSFHIVAEDEDGFDDIELIHLISDEEELYWSLDAQTWLQSDVDSEHWIGTNRITMADLAPLPRGDYRVLLANLGGDMDEESFTLDIAPIKHASIPFPRAVVDTDAVSVEGVFLSYTLIVYTTADEYVKSVSVEDEPQPIRKIKSGDAGIRGGFTFYVYTYWERRGVGLLVGPYAVD